MSLAVLFPEKAGVEFTPMELEGPDLGISFFYCEKLGALWVPKLHLRQMLKSWNLVPDALKQAQAVNDYMRVFCPPLQSPADPAVRLMPANHYNGHRAPAYECPASAYVLLHQTGLQFLREKLVQFGEPRPASIPKVTDPFLVRVGRFRNDHPELFRFLFELGED